MLEKIRKNIKKRMTSYTNSRQPTGDEVMIVWLVSEVDRLKEELLSSQLPLSTGALLDMKVVGKPSYVPATSNSTPQKCLIKVRTKSNNKERFTITAKGKLADICACHLSEDRQIDCTYTCNTKIELVLKEIVLGPGPNISINTKTEKYTGGDEFGFAKVVHDKALYDSETPGIEKIMDYIEEIMARC